MRPARRLLALLFAAAGASCSDGVAPDASDRVALSFSLQAPAAVSQAETDVLAASFALVNTYQVTVQDSATQSPLVDATLTLTAGTPQHSLDVALPRSTVGLPVLVTVVGRNGSQELYRTSTYMRVQDASVSTPVALSVRYTGPGIRGRVTNAAGVSLPSIPVALMQGSTVIATATTELDGTYLFVNRPNGLYQVQPTPPGGQFLCPATRNVNIATATSSLIADFATRATACQIDLLILSGGDLAFDDDTIAVKAMFVGVPNVNTSAFFFVNNTPGLSVLNQYDVVLLFANGLFNQSSALGTEIARYVQLGGNVITSTFYWQNRSDSGLGAAGWGSLEALDPFTSGPPLPLQTYQAASLNASATVAHPLTTGLLTLTSTGFRGAVAAKAGTTVVARWNDGSPLVGYQILPWGSRMVAVSLFPASGAAATGDVLRLWRNAVTWAGAAGGPIP